MPSIRNWAKKQALCLKHGTKRNGKKIISVGGKKEELALHRNVGTAIEKSEGDEELEEVAMEVLKNSNLKQTAIDLLWQQTVLDITNTLHEAAQMVLHDQNVTPEIRKARAEGLEVIGVIFGTAQRPEGVSAPEDQEELENVAFHAVLDTVWRQEMSSRSNANPEADD
jgi:X-domain of DnaJ-containing